MSFMIDYGISKNICDRKNMEDYNYHFFSIIEEIGFFNICDGHGGKEVSNFINKNFFKTLLKNIRKEENKINDEKIDNKLIINKINKTCYILDNKTKKIDHCGSTFIGIFFYNNYIFIINIGDSLLFINKNDTIVFKTVLHIPSNKIEKKRILKTSFIKNNRINNIINVSRAFGDYMFKKEKNIKDNPITYLPDITVFPLKLFFGNDSWVLLSSDGLFLNLSIDLIHKAVSILLEIGHTSQKITNLLASYCKKNNNKDNVTIILIILSKNKEEEKYNYIKHLKKNIISILLKNKKEEKEKLTYKLIENHYNELIQKMITKKLLKFVFELIKSEIINYVLLSH